MRITDGPSIRVRHTAHDHPLSSAQTGDLMDSALGYIEPALSVRCRCARQGTVKSARVPLVLVARYA